MDRFSFASPLSWTASEQIERESSAYYPWGSPVSSPDSGKMLWNKSMESRSSNSPAGLSPCHYFGKTSSPKVPDTSYCRSSWTEGISLEDHAERPNSLDLRKVLIAPSSAESSGYNTGESSTVSEHAPFDWDTTEAAPAELTDIDDQLQIIFPENQQFQCGEHCSFVVYFPALSNSNVLNLYKNIEAYVLAPESDRYPVLVSPGELGNEIKCSFKPFTCGTFKVCIRSLLTFKSASGPDVVAACEVQKNFVKATPIISVDIELPAWDAETEVGAMRHPWGISCNVLTEELIVPDRSRHEVLVYQTDGSLSFAFGSQGSGPGQFFRPVAATYDQKRNRIIVVDKDNHRVQFFDPQGKYLGEFGRYGNAVGCFKFPWGIDISPDGEFIAVADTRNRRVQVFDYMGKPVKVIKGGSLELVEPRSVCFSKTSDEVFITDFKLHHVLKYDLHSRILTIIVRNLQRPSGLSLDHVGNLLVCNNRGNSVLVYPKEKGHQIQVIQRIGNQHIEQPSDMTLMKGSYMAVLDHNGRITVF